MPECKALRTFNSKKYGHIRMGSRFSSDPPYAAELASLGLIQILREPLTREPALVQAIKHAPHVAGKELTVEPPAPVDPNSADPPAAGAEPPSRLSRVARALRRPTARKSKAGAKP